MKKPSKRQVTAAVTALRLYMGSSGTCRLADQQRLYERFRKAMRPLEAFTSDAHEQVKAEAQKLGRIVPKPGKDI